MNRDELIEHMARAGVRELARQDGNDIAAASAPLVLDWIDQGQTDFVAIMAAALRAIEAAGAVVVPREAINWLNGIGDDFERPANARGAFWWRVEFCRRAQLRMNADGTIAGTLADPHYAEKNNDTR